MGIKPADDVSRELPFPLKTQADWRWTLTIQGYTQNEILLVGETVFWRFGRSRMWQSIPAWRLDGLLKGFSELKRHMDGQ